MTHLALALAHIAPQYNAAQHKRAAERMVQDMEKTAHTPGPWTVEDATEVVARVPSPNLSKGRPDVLTICRAVDVEIYHDNRAGSTEANARLLASAPDLLAALEDLESRCQELVSRTEQLDRLLLKGQEPECTLGEVDRANAAISAARAAIAKARGK